MDATKTTTTQWPQGIGVVKTMEADSMLERSRARPQKDQALNCPRCNSTNTKFCYYNNYSLSQPRYFCKTCRRYWTEGGSLRNVPVGGCSRKNKRPSSTPSSSSAAASASSKKLPLDLTPPNFSQSASQNPKIHEGQDLNLAYPPSSSTDDHCNLLKFVEVPYSTESNKTHQQNPNSSSTTTPSHHHHISAMELLKSAGMNSRGFSSFMSIPVSDSNAMFSAGFPLQEYKPTLNFSLEGFEGGYGNIQGVHEAGSARLLFPVDELKQVPSNTEFGQQNVARVQGDHTPPGYWNGMLGGGSW